MKCFVLSCCLVVLVAAVSALPSAQEWNQYKLEHGKVYSSRGEEAMRRANFERSKAMIAKLNDQHRGQTQFKLNHLSDISDEEYAKMNGARVQESDIVNTRTNSIDELVGGMHDDLPKHVDWRDVPGRVSQVKDQGQCGSCWAFSATGTVEGVEVLKNISLTPLSEQQLMDCSKVNSKCEGGSSKAVLMEIIGFEGMMSEADYPYTAKDSSVCKYNRTDIVLKTSTVIQYSSGDDRSLMKSVSGYGPISVVMHATSHLQHYAGGVLDDPTCTHLWHDINHAVLLIGYGTDEKQGDYWLVKNSWGEKWGEKGYFRLSRKTTNKCGISVLPIAVMV